MTRGEHLQWCKDRAIEYINIGDLSGAFASMCSDVMKHEETNHHQTTNELGMMQLASGHLDTREKMQKWIEDYN